MLPRIPPPITGALVLLAAAGCADERIAPVARAEPPPVVDANGRVPDLVCPGDPGCESAAGELHVGAAARPITPPVEPWTDLDGDGLRGGAEPFEDKNGNGAWDPVWLAGFGQGRAATGVHDDVWTRVVVVERGDVAFALVALDLVGLFHDDVIRIRLAAQDAGLALDHIVVSTTHTHEAPDTLGIWGKSVAESGYDDAYVTDTIVAATVEALKEARASARPARARLAVTEAPALVNDTRLPKVVDQALTALQFLDAATAAPIATTVFWGNHPEALGSSNTLVTSDYVHSLREELETRYPTAVAAFFSGSLGGLSTPIGIVGCPSPQGEETCPQGTFARAEYVGRGAGAAAADALDAPTALELGGEDLSPSIRRRSFLLTTSNASLALAFWFGLLPRTLFWVDSGLKLTEEEVLGLVPADLLSETAALQTEINVVTLGPISLVAVPGELYPELWLSTPSGGSYAERPEGADFPDATGERPLQSFLGTGAVPVVINNANDALGYILPKSQWDQKPPFAYGEVDAPQYGEENSLGAETAGRIAEEFERLTSAP